MLLYWLWFANCIEGNDRLKAELLQHFPDPEDLFSASREELAQTGISGLTGEKLDALCSRDLSAAEKILEDCTRKNIRLLTYGDDAYPQRLKSIGDAPMVLYYKGVLPEFDTLPTVAIVGTRHASAYGKRVAANLGREIAQQGGLVVSGLAEGIDGAAMEAALLDGYPAAGVLGCGVDIVYPRCNRELFLKTERLGCILSEFAPGTPPIKWNFPKRNRVISGLSCGVVVVEAPARSGALLTARHALEQGRDVFAVPGNVDMENFVGSNRLLRDGAIAVSSGSDVLAEYRDLYPGKLHRHPAAPKPPVRQEKTGESAPVSKKFKEKTIDNGAPAPYIGKNDTLAGLSPEEQTVLSAIPTESIPVDDVIAACGLPSGKVLGILTVLEIKKRIVRLPGKRVSRQR